MAKFFYWERLTYAIAVYTIAPCKIFLRLLPPKKGSYKMPYIIPLPDHHGYNAAARRLLMGALAMRHFIALAVVAGAFIAAAAMPPTNPPPPPVGFIVDGAFYADPHGAPGGGGWRCYTSHYMELNRWDYVPGGLAAAFYRRDLGGYIACWEGIRNFIPQ